jgi:hypothetical protein
LLFAALGDAQFTGAEKPGPVSFDVPSTQFPAGRSDG